MLLHPFPSAKAKAEAMPRLIILAALLALTPIANAQGCSQCRDNTAATPIKTQAAYRHAIILLVAAAGTLFTGTLILLRRSR